MKNLEPASDIARLSSIAIGDRFEGSEVTPHNGRCSFDR